MSLWNLAVNFCLNKFKNLKKSCNLTDTKEINLDIIIFLNF